MNPGGAGIPPPAPGRHLARPPLGAPTFWDPGAAAGGRGQLSSVPASSASVQTPGEPPSLPVPPVSPQHVKTRITASLTQVLSVCSVPAAVFTSAGPAAGQRSPGVSRPWGGVEPETPLRGNPLGYERRCGSCRAGCPGLGESQGREARLLTGCLQYLGQVEPGGRGSDALDQSPSRAS